MHNIAGLLVILVVPLPVWADGSTDPKLVDVLDFVDDYHDELYRRKGRLYIIKNIATSSEARILLSRWPLSGGYPDSKNTFKTLA